MWNPSFCATSAENPITIKHHTGSSSRKTESYTISKNQNSIKYQKVLQENLLPPHCKITLCAIFLAKQIVAITIKYLCFGLTTVFTRSEPYIKLGRILSNIICSEGEAVQYNSGSWGIDKDFLEKYFNWPTLNVINTNGK